MQDGSLLYVTKIGHTADSLSMELAGGAKLKDGAIADVVSLQGLGGEKFIYLSGLKPVDYRHVPYLSIEWPYRDDRGVMGRSLTVSGQQYTKGIGMHSAARLTYRLDGKYRRLEAMVALDDSSNNRGSVSFGVYLLSDGGWKQAAVSKVVRGGDAPQPLLVDLRGAEMLTLTVDFADRGDELDHADWLDARLIRDSE
jgi:hypothetical protein